MTCFTTKKTTPTNVITMPSQVKTPTEDEVSNDCDKPWDTGMPALSAKDLSPPRDDTDRSSVSNPASAGQQPSGVVTNTPDTEPSPASDNSVVVSPGIVADTSLLQWCSRTSERPFYTFVGCTVGAVVLMGLGLVAHRSLTELNPQDIRPLAHLQIEMFAEKCLKAMELPVEWADKLTTQILNNLPYAPEVYPDYAKPGWQDKIDCPTNIFTINNATHPPGTTLDPVGNWQQLVQDFINQLNLVRGIPASAAAALQPMHFLLFAGVLLAMEYLL